MKKLFLALTCAVLTLSTVACNNEEDMPTPVNGQQNAIEASFPKGAKVKTLNINVPDLQRTRAGEDTNFGFWSAFNNDTHDIKIRYAIYDDDDNVFFCSDQLSEEVHTYVNSFTIKVPLPEYSSARIFIWADKLGKAGHDNYQGYRIDWEKTMVYMPSVNMSGALAELSKIGDAWCCEAEIDESTTNVTLKRQMSQIILATDEFELESIASAYGNIQGSTTYWYGKPSEDCSTKESGYTVLAWDWSTHEIFYKKQPQFAFFIAKPMNYEPIIKGGRTLYPLMSTYVFCDYVDGEEEIHDHENNTQASEQNINDIYFQVKYGNLDKTFKASNTLASAPNCRFIFSPKSWKDGEGGIFTSGNGEIQCNIDQTWSTTNNYVIN